MERWGNPRLLWWDLEGARRRSLQPEDGIVRLVRAPSLNPTILRGFDNLEIGSRAALVARLAVARQVGPRAARAFERSVLGR